MTETSYKVAAVQFEPTLYEKERNITRLLALVETAAQGGAKLIVTPEMGTTGYCWYDRAEVAPFVEPVPGPTTDRFAVLAHAYDCYIVIGMPEVDPETNLYHNTAVLIGPEGVIGRHRKSHSYIAEPKWAVAGDEHAVFETPIGRIAMLVCMDIHFIETARLDALGGADVICHISNWLAERCPAPYWITRAFENGCYVIEANRWGLERTVEFSGGSCILGPDGSMEAVLDCGDGVVYGTVDLARARARKVLGEPVFAQRRPALYAELMTNTFLWNPLDFFRLYGYRALPQGGVFEVAAAQFTPGDDTAANLDRATRYAAEASAKGAVLLVLPEYALTGTARANAVGLDGPEVARLVNIAIRHRLHIVAGLIEAEGEARYSTAVLVGPEGIVGRYRKIHLTTAEAGWATAGDDWAVFDLPFGRLGLLIGHDLAFPEAGRVLALRGVDVIAAPAAIAGRISFGHPGSKVAQNPPIPTGADPHHWLLFRVRAGENNVWLVAANHIDEAKGFAGKSGIFGPDSFAFPRREAFIPEGEGLVTATIDTGTLPGSPYPTNVVRRKDLVAMRQVHHYLPLVRQD
ncbi:nitrilase-related carbon-nitrogen hydrolase [Tistrella mobilis]|uniref:nitrilase-related carbon-nitrogen hydrolase n=1 Tax=Tistrella mobilis TaxID=171437 RepID=UPI0035578A4C